MSPVPPRDIAAAVRSELATPGRYHLHDAARHRSWLELAASWIYDRFADFERALAAHVHVGASATGLLGDVLVILCVGIVAFAGARLLMALQAERTARAVSLPLETTRNAAALARAASDAAASGAYGRAIRLLFAASVALLDLRGLLRDDRSATVNELRHAVRERAADAEIPFVEIARAYTSEAYAERPADRDAWTAASAAYDVLSRGVRS